MLKKENNKVVLTAKVVFFATGNINKFNEARSILSSYGIALGMIKLKGDEIQSDSIQKIAEKSVINAYKFCRTPIFVEDAGLFIDALKGFPGPYAAYVYKTIRNDGILKLMKNENCRKAKFESIISFCDRRTKGKPQSFSGEIQGEITVSERNEPDKSGFGFDPIFQPEGSAKTFAEMTIDEKNCYSHRSRAIHKFAEWYKNRS